MTFCPDCEQWVPEDDFVAHREAVHPPVLLVVSPQGITSEESVHGQAKE